MEVCYRDGDTYRTVKLDFFSVVFLDGEAHFSSNGEEYHIPMTDLVEIGE